MCDLIIYLVAENWSRLFVVHSFKGFQLLNLYFKAVECVIMHGRVEGMVVGDFWSV